MAFRDTFDQCPRCAITLEDAQSARGCRNCGGAFVTQPVLAEMLLAMVPPGRLYGPLVLSEVTRTGSALACPSCNEPMKPTTIHGVELDHCKKHGVWFDVDELRITLYRAADAGSPPPFEDWDWAAVAPLPAAEQRLPQRPLQPPRTTAWRGPGIGFRIALPDGSRHEITLADPVIKIGRIATCQLRIDDPSVNRLHAVIELGPELTVIDLGSTTGTFVNERRITKATLAVGDYLRIGDARIDVVSRAP